MTAQLDRMVYLMGCQEKSLFSLKPNTAFQDKHFILTVKHGSGGGMISACFATMVTGHFVVTDHIDQIPLQRRERLIQSCKNNYFKLLLQKLAQQGTESWGVLIVLCTYCVVCQ